MSNTTPFAAILARPDLDPDLLPPLEMDGYLTGVLLTPNLEAEQWVPGLWKYPPDLEDRDRLQRALASALMRQKAIQTDLQKAKPDFRPSFSEVGKDADHARIRIWMRGFSKAMRVDPEYWIDIAEDERSPLLALLVGFMDTPEDMEERDDADALRDEHAALLPRALLAMYKLALLSEGDAQALRSMQKPKVGRNEPCPCGSGQKFKRCCGAS
jgi:uncharacterized protein